MNTSDDQMSDIASESSSVRSGEQRTLDLVHQLLESFQNDQNGMTFACGGSVPIPVANSPSEQTSTVVDPRPTCPPVCLRWDPDSDSVPAAMCRLRFPLDHTEDETARNLQQLLHDMQPATFGYQGQDILDESYRKASKLDPSRFGCTFNPHELGIVDEVARILLPGVKHRATSDNGIIVCYPRPDGEDVMSLRAELYKLNVYSGPSGHFKAHVDTPRSTEQIGSLVVCLPCAHQGGQLEVRHEDRSMTFDWSMPEASRPEVQWAAFYSDCEHEVKEVTSGHRITLTYNLYARSESSTEASQIESGFMDPTKFPSYDILAELFLQENFMPDGGYLGAHTSHAYPHTSTSTCLTAVLKGSDKVAWETFRSLGCGVGLRPVIELPEWSHYGHDRSEPCPAADLTDESSEEDDEEVENEEVEDGGVEDEGVDAPASRSAKWKVDADEVQALQQELNELKALPDTEFPGLEPQGRLLPGFGPEVDEELTDAEFERIGDRVGCRVLGSTLSFRAFDHVVEDDDCMDSMLDEWTSKESKRSKKSKKRRGPAKPKRVLYEEVAWLNHSGRHKEPQISYAAYGNEAHPSMMYSTCGIVAEVPPYPTRKALLVGEQFEGLKLEAGTN
ncbi:hypothetical protein Daus18300_006592 [Diaporthe australafricana]|uniref:Fe2OG dioxygenase domain-containing protein n=1 Tax=Diaporthe australafricana TaxID=127596 RepID=A0ABR3WT75_9PEZI